MAGAVHAESTVEALAGVSKPNDASALRARLALAVKVLTLQRAAARSGHPASNGTRSSWDPGEFRTRLAVFVTLVVGLVAPMCAYPLYCDAVMWVFFAGVSVEYWVSVFRCGNVHQRDIPWTCAAFLIWVLPTTLVCAKYQEVLGHRRLVECIIIQLVFGDSAQLLCGRAFGCHFICGTLSPKKTLEGYVGGAILTSMYGVLVHGWPTADIAVAFAAGCVGDLYFSAVKRKLGLKDFSRLLLSHGGLLDRLDSFVFASNALFWSRWAMTWGS